MAAQDRIDLFLRSQENSPNKFPHIDVSRLCFYESSSEPWGLKDLNSRYIYVNKPYLDLLNIPEEKNITGKTFEEVVGIRDDFSDSIHEHELLVIHNKKAVYSREVRTFGLEQQIELYIFKRMPYFSELNTVVAIEFNGMPWDKLAPIHSMNDLSQTNSPRVLIKKPTDKLTEREWEIVFLISTGKSRKQVSTELNISEKWIEKCLEMCAKKLNVDTPKNIPHFVFLNGWNNYLPKNILEKHRGYIILHRG